jgi:hypothetical protein
MITLVVRMIARITWTHATETRTNSLRGYKMEQHNIKIETLNREESKLSVIFEIVGEGYIKKYAGTMFLLQTKKVN